MRLVFVGSSRLGLRCLEAVQGLPGVHVVGVVTNPATFTISYRPTGVTNVLHEDFEPFARSHGIPCYRMREAMKEHELLSTVRAWEPDLFLVVGWYHMVPGELLAVAPAVGLHASWLPDYSGGAPLVWAMLNGEQETGVTLFWMDEGVDSGPVLSQRRIPIGPEETIADLLGRVEAVSLEMVVEAMPQLVAGTAPRLPQDASRRRVMPQRGPDDGRLDWSWSAERVYNFIRAQTRPYPGAFTQLGDARLTCWAAHLTERSGEGPPGSYVWTQEALEVTCGDGYVVRVTNWEVRGLFG